MELLRRYLIVWLELIVFNRLYKRIRLTVYYELFNIHDSCTQKEKEYINEEVDNVRFDVYRTFSSGRRGC